MKVNGARAWVLGALVCLAAVGSFVRPTAARIFLRRAALSQTYEPPNVYLGYAEEALAADPLLDQARDFLLHHYLRKDQEGRAAVLLDEAARLQPENASVYENLGDLMLTQDNPVGAAEQFRKAVDTDHGSPDLHRYYAKLINASSKFADRASVEADLKTAIRQNIAVINLIDWEKTERPDGRDDQFLRTAGGNTLRLEDVLDSIYAELKAKEAAGPQDRFDWLSLFQAYHNAFLYDKALAVLDDVERIFGDRERAEVNAFRALIAKEKGKIEESVQLLAQAHEIGDSTNPAANWYFDSLHSGMASESAMKDPQEVIREQRRILSKVEDFAGSRVTYTTILDRLIEAHRALDDPAGMIAPMKAWLFFESDRLNRVDCGLDLARCCMEAGRFEEAEQAVLDALDQAAVQKKRISELDDLERRQPLEDAACLMADLYRRMGLAPADRLRRLRGKTDCDTSNPCRIVFFTRFLVESELPEKALPVLAMALMDEKKALFLLELKAECCQMVDDLDSLRETYKSIDKAFQAKGISVQDRNAGLVAEVVKHPENDDLIHELVLSKSYEGKYDHALLILEGLIERRGLRNAKLLTAGARVSRLDNQPDRAMDYLRRALEVDPTYFRARITMRYLASHLYGPETAPPVTEAGR